MANASQPTLAQLRPGQWAVIRRVNARDSRVQRLMVLGLVEGARVQFIRSAIGGDPLEFDLFGCKLSLRAEQARCFQVTVVPADD